MAESGHRRGLRRPSLGLSGLGFVLAGCAWTLTPDALGVVDSVPSDGETHPGDLPLEVRFDRYLYPVFATTGEPGRGIRLYSGEIELSVRSAYDPVGRALVVAPVEELLGGVGYRLEIAPEAVFGLDGSTLATDFGVSFLAGRPVARPPAPHPDFERDVAPIFAQRCSCHGEAAEGRVAPALTIEGLVGQPSQRLPGLELVTPGAPLRSALIRKVLPDYPGVPGEPMPPSGPLDEDALRLLVSWVEGL
jgi:hypothetical protein